MARYVLIGAIARPHGIKGDVQVVPFPPASPLWSVGVELALIPARAAERSDDTVDVEQVKVVTIKRLSSGPKGRLITWMDGISTRTEAEHQKGAWLAVAEDALGELEEGEFWYHEVIGWPVVSTADAPLGTVVRIQDGPTDLLEVRPVLGGETYYIPMVDEFLIEVDREGARIVVAPIEGLVP